MNPLIRKARERAGRGKRAKNKGTARQCNAQAKERPIAALSPASVVNIWFIIMLLRGLRFAHTGSIYL